MFKKLKEKIVKGPVFPGIVIILIGMIPILDFIIFFRKGKGYYLPSVGIGFLLVGFGIYVLIVELKGSRHKK